MKLIIAVVSAVLSIVFIICEAFVAYPGGFTELYFAMVLRDVAVGLAIIILLAIIACKLVDIAQKK